MPIKRLSSLFLLVCFLLSLASISSAAVNRISGNGYTFPETPSYKAIFSMDVSKDGANPPSGLVKYYYSRTRMNMVSTAITDLTISGVGTTGTITGACTVNNVAGYTFSMTVSDGSRDSIQVVIKRSDGSNYYSAGTKNLAGGNLIVTDTIPPTVMITSPANLITVATSPITVSGTIDDPTAVLTVNGITAPIVNGGFSVPGVVITEGMNTIVARAVDPANNTATSSINISLDSTPPHIAINSPPDGYRTTTSPLTVTGIINDIVRGTVNESQGRVLVNGTEADVSNRNFLAEIPLSSGANTITAVGSDQWGNTASTSITVNFDTTPRRMVNLVSGNNQSGMVSSTLPNPLVVSLVDETGAPIENKKVIFSIIENNGTLFSGLSGGRSIAVDTAHDGSAQAFITLGTWAGSGNNRVEVTATGVDGSVIFNESGVSRPPAAIYVAQGNQQRGAVNQPLPQPLVAFVTDEGHNPLRNVPVIFSAVAGGGHFSNGLNTLTVNSDSDGRATTAFTLGPDAGNDSNVIEATFDGNTLPPAGFTATSLIPGDAGSTRISGVVLDNSNNPIPHVTMRVEGTIREALTDNTGQFVINNVPVGPVHLIADGSTAGIPDILEYPTLMYELTTVSGADNSVGMPIYLVPLDLENAKLVGGDQDVTYTIPSVPGFSFTIKANSVTFPDGRKQGLISVTQVHGDKVPMVPQIGQQPKFIVTIQPPGTVFDPPAPITIPNVDGLAPGEKTNMYSFDHDLGVFVSIGTGTVSDDGLVISSDPGVGVVKAGWHCGGNPAPTGSANVCPDCQKCDGTKCVADASKNGQSCEDTKGNFEIACGTGTVKVDIDPSCKGKCKDGNCKDDPFGINLAKTAITSAVGKFCDSCIDNASGLRDKIQKFLKDNGFKVTCNAAGTDCASAAPGSNTFELTPKALDVAKCDALDSSTVHEMVHAAASFRHRKCKADGTVLGEISCDSGADCQVCVDPDTDKSYGCEAACYPTTGSKVGKASACK
ncbi:MAG: carboxypeptidase regulatory-like domain-containing protein [Nitrospira sp.]|nr:carboxypeptidase regulatory-like domain-containing protein [Nitrospira sp.]